MSVILALDQGTTSCRAVLFDQAGSIRAIAQEEFRQIYPQAGWVEHDPLEIWSAQLEVGRRVLAKAGVKAKEIAALGITNQRETTVVWDSRTGQPVHNAIVWQDRRTAAFCDELKRSGRGELIARKSGLVIDAYFSGSKLHWLLDNLPGARERAGRGELAFGTIDTWLLWNLTGGGLHVTDPSNASRTMLLNLHTGAWDDELLAVLDVPPEVQWLRDGLGLIKSSAEVEALASSVPDSGGVYLVPAFAGLGAPHWDQYARGTITGLTRGSTAAHLARAALEGIAFQVADVLDVMKADSGIGLNELRVDGGAAANNLLMQFQADILSNQISPRR